MDDEEVVLDMDENMLQEDVNAVVEALFEEDDAGETAPKSKKAGAPRKRKNATTSQPKRTSRPQRQISYDGFDNDSDDDDAQPQVRRRQKAKRTANLHASEPQSPQSPTTRIFVKRAAPALTPQQKQQRENNQKQLEEHYNAYTEMLSGACNASITSSMVPSIDALLNMVEKTSIQPPIQGGGTESVFVRFEREFRTLNEKYWSIYDIHERAQYVNKWRVLYDRWQYLISHHRLEDGVEITNMIQRIYPGIVASLQDSLVKAHDIASNNPDYQHPLSPTLYAVWSEQPFPMGIPPVTNTKKKDDGSRAAIGRTEPVEKTARRPWRVRFAVGDSSLATWRVKNIENITVEPRWARWRKLADKKSGPKDELPNISIDTQSRAYHPKCISPTLNEFEFRGVSITQPTTRNAPMEIVFEITVRVVRIIQVQEGDEQKDVEQEETILSTQLISLPINVPSNENQWFIGEMFYVSAMAFSTEALGSFGEPLHHLGPDDDRPIRYERFFNIMQYSLLLCTRQITHGEKSRTLVSRHAELVAKLATNYAAITSVEKTPTDSAIESTKKNLDALKSINGLRSRTALVRPLTLAELLTVFPPSSTIDQDQHYFIKYDNFRAKWPWWGVVWYHLHTASVRGDQTRWLWLDGLIHLHGPYDNMSTSNPVPHQRLVDLVVKDPSLCTHGTGIISTHIPMSALSKDLTDDEFMSSYKMPNNTLTLWVLTQHDHNRATTIKTGEPVVQYVDEQTNESVIFRVGRVDLVPSDHNYAKELRNQANLERLIDTSGRLVNVRRLITQYEMRASAATSLTKPKVDITALDYDVYDTVPALPPSKRVCPKQIGSLRLLSLPPINPQLQITSGNAQM